MKQAWRSFSGARPGQRFIQNYRRAQQDRSIAWRILRFTVGVALTVGGVFLLFLPGPGGLLILFGLAMFAGESRRLAEALDRGEVFLRARIERLRLWWRPVSPSS